ncbi:hypothetical protein Tco_0491841 [Tanacetum coccineum]
MGGFSREDVAVVGVIVDSFHVECKNAHKQKDKKQLREVDKAIPLTLLSDDLGSGGGLTYGGGKQSDPSSITLVECSLIILRHSGRQRGRNSSSMCLSGLVQQDGQEGTLISLEKFPFSICTCSEHLIGLGHLLSLVGASMVRMVGGQARDEAVGASLSCPQGYGRAGEGEAGVGFARHVGAPFVSRCIYRGFVGAVGLLCYVMFYGLGRWAGDRLNERGAGPHGNWPGRARARPQSQGEGAYPNLWCVTVPMGHSTGGDRLGGGGVRAGEGVGGGAGLRAGGVGGDLGDGPARPRRLPNAGVAAVGWVGAGGRPLAAGGPGSYKGQGTRRGALGTPRPLYWSYPMSEGYFVGKGGLSGRLGVLLL